MLKRIVNMALAMVLVISLIPLSVPANATSYTSNDAISWLQSKEGQAIDYDGAYGAQCVDLVMAYYKYLIGWNVSGNGADYATNTLPTGWIRTKGGQPQKGDILVYAGGTKAGHVAIYESDYITWHQNWGGQYVRRITNKHYTDYKAYDGATYWGCIHPNFSGSSTPLTVDSRYPTPFKAYCLTLGSSSSGRTTLYASVNGSKSGKYIYNGYKGDDDLCTIEEVYTNGWCKVTVPGVDGYQYCKLSVFVSGSPTITSTTTTQKMTTYRRKDGATAYGSIGSGNTVTVLGTSGSYTQVIYVGKQSVKKCMWVLTSDLKPNYTVKYNANGGTGAPASQIKSHDVALTLSSTKPTRTGYSFVGWATSSDATSAEYKAGGIYEINFADTLYAVWKANIYTVKYNANGGTGTMADQSHTYAASKKLNTNTFTREGYTFAGWATSDTGIVVYTDGQSVKNLTSVAKGTVYLYAVWEADTYIVTYDANGGSGAPSSQTKTHGVSVTLSATKPTRTGYTFLGWSTNPTATSAIYQSGDSFSDNDDTTLYAVWIQGCENGSHSYTPKVTAPICTEQGYTTHTCSNCGDVYVDSYVNALGHSFTKYQSNGDATCTEDGTKTAKCDRCDATDTVTDVGSKTGHTMSNWYVTKESTCTEKGTERSDCVVCDHYEIREITAKGHSYTEKVTAPTCTEKGHTTHTCACGASYVDTYTPVLGHDYGEWYQTKAPTLEAEGEERRDCSRCDDCQTRKIPMLVHNYTSVVTPPSCTEQGYTTHTCSNCGDAYVDSYVNALGHSFTKYASNGDATCIADGTKTAKCDRCDAIDTVTDVGSKTGHDMGEWYVTKDPTCTEKGTEQSDCAKCDHYETREIDAKGHSYTEKVKTPTCTEQGYTTHTCKCGDSYIDSYIDSYTEAAGHSWNSGVVTKEPTESKEGIRTYTCAACGEERTEPIPALEHKHSYTTVVTAPTCTDKGYTTHTCACGDSYVDAYTAALGHAWDEGVVTEATCFQDGYTTYTCYCGASYVDDRIPSHVINPFDDNFGDRFYEKLIKATCTEAGGIFYICKECGESTLYLYMEAKGHDLGEWETVKEPNYLENGQKERHCSRCDVFESEEIHNNPFTDVGEGSRFKKPILWAYYSGVTSGKTATTFEPNTTVNRAQAVTFLWRAAGCPEPEGTENPFTDVGEGAYYYKAVMWAVENGITSGTTATTFSPNKLCTRGHIAMFLYNYAGKPDVTLQDDRFEDVTSNNRYYKAVMWAIQEKITSGKTENSFGLHQECTRAHVVTFLYKLLEEKK